jgi:hypothetical protein
VALIQTGSTIYADGSSSGLTQLVYGCDGCEADTGNPYENIAFALGDGSGVFDWSELEGWAQVADEDGDTREYCPACSDRAATLRALIGEEPA